MAPQLIITLPSDAGTAPADWRPQLERARAALEALQTAGPAAQAEVAAARAGLAAGAEQLAAAEVEASAQLAPLREEHRAATAAVAVLQQEEAGRREYVAQLEGELAYLNKAGGRGCTSTVGCRRVRCKVGCWGWPIHHAVIWPTPQAAACLYLLTSNAALPLHHPCCVGGQELEERQAEVAQQGDSMSDTRPVARLAAACTQLQRELAEMEVRQGVLQAMLLGAA